MYKTPLLFCITLFLCLPASLHAQAPWSVESYTDEAGYQQRIAGMLERIASQGFGQRSLSRAKCPDTGLTFTSYALEGETVFSPYTGRAVKQGPTGYFGAKVRDSLGRVVTFGGDPLKFDLPPATATLLLNPSDAHARAFLSIPGNLSQHYHFAAKNWARFYPLLAHHMGDAWKRDFWQAAGRYQEHHRPSDGYRVYAPLSTPHNLIGEPGELLGGNKKDGGTENHKLMWRTSALLYSQWFPNEVFISEVPVPEARKLTFGMLTDYAKKILQAGNGEYDSQIYYTHAMYGFYNLYDFSPDTATRQLAKFMLDYYWATYALKTVDGAFAGAQKRGYLTTAKSNEMRSHLWVYTGSSPGLSSGRPVSSLHQATSAYRPNRLIMDVFHSALPLPFAVKIVRPSYHIDIPNMAQEYVWVSQGYTMGHVALTAIDNPGQQIMWSLVAKSPKGPLSFGGLHPRFTSPNGHSPYTQTFQHENALIVLTGPYQEAKGASLSAEQQQRKTHGSASLNPATFPAGQDTASWATWLRQAPQTAATWFFAPATVEVMQQHPSGWWGLDAGDVWVAVFPLGKAQRWVKPEPAAMNALEKSLPAIKVFEDFQVLAINGEYSGFAVWVAEKTEFTQLADLLNHLSRHQPVMRPKSEGLVSWVTPKGHTLVCQYQRDALRARGSIDQQPVVYENWANGYVYDSPFLKVGNGLFYLSNGKEAYGVRFQGETPVYEEVLVD